MYCNCTIIGTDSVLLSRTLSIVTVRYTVLEAILRPPAQQTVITEVTVLGNIQHAVQRYFIVLDSAVVFLSTIAECSGGGADALCHQMQHVSVEN